MRNHRYVNLERRRLLRGTLEVAALASFGTLFHGRALAQPAAAPAPAPGGPPPLPAGTTLVMLGTRGGPGVNLEHGQTASAVVVDGVAYLVDCGYGTLRALVASNIGLQRVSTVVISHLHNDHTSDIAALLSMQWTGSKSTQTHLYGPYATARMVEGAIAFFRGDVEVRMVDEGRTVLPETLFFGHDVPATAAPTEVLKDSRVTITAVENTHYPERATAAMPHRSLAYRFDTRDRSIVFSGDTAYSANVVRLARGADILVSEVIAQSVYDQNMARARADAEAGNANSVARHIAETHSTPADVGRMAREAQVGAVVLNHQVPGARSGGLDFPVSEYIDGVRSEFDGLVIVGQDQMVL
jgi:ribonuclease BN (tRNA processing enzyme)